MKIANDLQQKLNGEIREWKAKYNKAKSEKDEIDEEQDELIAKNKQLKQDNENYRAEVAEWKKKYEELETKLEATKPSMLYQTLDKMGLVSIKNTLVNTSAIVGVVVVIYAISWMWKHLIKPTYYNFKGEPKPPSHSPQIIKEEPVRVIEPARSDQAGYSQPNSPRPKSDEVETATELTEQKNKEPQTETKPTKKTKKKKRNSS
jgi:hypothetical protein